MTDIVSRYRVRQHVTPPAPDAPGRALKPDPLTAAAVPEFLEALANLRIWAGAPSYRDLSRRCAGGLPRHSTFVSMLTGDTLPRLDLVLVYVDALGLSADRDQWTAAWRRLAFINHREETGRG